MNRQLNGAELLLAGQLLQALSAASLTSLLPPPERLDDKSVTAAPATEPRSVTMPNETSGACCRGPARRRMYRSFLSWRFEALSSPMPRLRHASGAV